MSTIQEIIVSASAEQDIIVANVNKTNKLVTETKQLLAANDIVGAQALLDSIAVNSTALINGAQTLLDLIASNIVSRIEVLEQAQE